jgi:hypothetical protein
MAMAESRQPISIQTAYIAKEIERTREICDRTRELLRVSRVDTFLGRKAEAPADAGHDVPDDTRNRKI